MALASSRTGTTGIFRPIVDAEAPPTLHRLKLRPLPTSASEIGIPSLQHCPATTRTEASCRVTMEAYGNGPAPTLHSTKDSNRHNSTLATALISLMKSTALSLEEVTRPLHLSLADVRLSTTTRRTTRTSLAGVGLCGIKALRQRLFIVTNMMYIRRLVVRVVRSITHRWWKGQSACFRRAGRVFWFSSRSLSLSPRVAGAFVQMSSLPACLRRDTLYLWECKQCRTVQTSSTRQPLYLTAKPMLWR